MPEPHHNQRGKKNDDPADGDLNKRQVFRFYAQTEESFKRVPECIHRQDCIAVRSFVARIRVFDAALARETVAWHKTTARQLCQQLHHPLVTSQLKRASFGSVSKNKSPRRCLSCFSQWWHLLAIDFIPIDALQLRRPR